MESKVRKYSHEDWTNETGQISSMVVLKQTDSMVQLNSFLKEEPTHYSSFFNGPTAA